MLAASRPAVGTRLSPAARASSSCNRNLALLEELRDAIFTEDVDHVTALVTAGPALLFDQERGTIRILETSGCATDWLHEQLALTPAAARTVGVELPRAFARMVTVNIERLRGNG